MAQSVGISWLWRLKSDATGSIPAGWVRGVTWVPIFLYSSIPTSLRKENHLETRLHMNRCGIISEGCVQLAAGLAENTGVQTLQIGGNRVGVEGAKALSKVIEENKTLLLHRDDSLGEGVDTLLANA